MVMPVKRVKAVDKSVSGGGFQAKKPLFPLSMVMVIKKEKRKLFPSPLFEN